MILELDPSTRRMLADCRCEAMRGDAVNAIRRLDEFLERIAHETNDRQSTIVHLATAMLKAEILVLDHRDHEAFLALADTALPQLTHLPLKIRAVVELNRNEAGSHGDSNSYVDDHYKLFDAHRVLGIALTDYSAITHASLDAAADKHYDALPSFWQEYLRTYYQGCWRPHRFAADRLASEFLQVGHPLDAAYYSVLAVNEELAKEVGARLVAWRNQDTIAAVVKKLLLAANLKSHAVVACALFVGISDCIPDDLIEPLAHWLMTRACLEPEKRLGSDVSRAARGALTAIAGRLNATLAEAVVEMALAHPSWTKPDMYRRELISVVSPCVATVSEACLATLAEQSIPLLHDKKFDFDYIQSIHLLCSIVERESKLRSRVAAAIFPDGMPVSAALLQVSHVFGKEIADSRALEQFAARVSEGVRQQVQHVSNGLEPVSPGPHSFTRAVQRGDGRVISFLSSFVDVQAVIRHRNTIGPEYVEELLAAILEKLVDPDNLLPNKERLIGCVGQLADVLTAEQRTRVFETMTALFNGAGLEEDEEDPMQQLSSALSRFRTEMGQPSRIRGEALVTLARISPHLTLEQAHHTHLLVDEALGDAEGEVRQRAIVAAHALVSLSDQGMTGLLLATRDPEPAIASMAFQAMAHKDTRKLSPVLLGLLYQSIELAREGAVVKVRAAAASLTRRLLADGFIDDPSRLRVAEAAFQQDISYAVRAAVLG